ncbi:nickel ABC transporter permease [Fusobacterium ulcerans]|uniref:nickel ABC transporter permease n=1 Tax=Fusobacterium ulcerans TaxID=861 RepID=UPI001032DE44|nr:nickel ABC transporter permease [Fusobacterium ulcerans]
MNGKNFLKKLFQIGIVLFGISFLTFALIYLSPGDPAEIMLTACGNIPTPELLAQTRIELGLDKPFLTQYGDWLLKICRGDMGYSYSLKVPVWRKLISNFFITLKLAVASLVLMVVISIPLGVFAAINRNKKIDYFVRGFTFIGISVPSFWLGLIFLSIFGVKLKLVPIAGGTANLKALILPAITLALSMSAKYTRQVRTIVLDELRQDYVTGARIRGMSEKIIMIKHILPNVLLPLVTLLGLSLGSLLSGTAVVEIVYNWPGMGSMAVKAISTHDYPLVQGYVLFIALFYMLINLAVDSSYKYLDPRLGEKH